MIIRKAKKDDLEGVLKLYQFLFKNEDYSEKDQFEKKWDEIIKYKGLEYFVVIENKEIVSSCNICIIPNMSRNQRSYALIENVITHPDYRRKGYGRAIIEEVIRYAKQENCYKVMLLSTASHDRLTAHKFYEDLGFDGNSKRGFTLKFN